MALATLVQEGISMTRHTLTLTAALAVAVVSLAACQPDVPAEAPAAAAPAPAAPAAPAPAPPAAAPMAAARITDVELGSTLDADGSIAEAKTTFAPMDNVAVAIHAAGADAAGTATGLVGTRWLDQDGKVVHEESKDFVVTGSGVTHFMIGKMDGWPLGRYTIEISLDGQPAMSREFEVR